MILIHVSFEPLPWTSLATNVTGESLMCLHGMPGQRVRMFEDSVTLVTLKLVFSMLVFHVILEIV